MLKMEKHRMSYDKDLSVLGLRSIEGSQVLPFLWCLDSGLSLKKNHCKLGMVVSKLLERSIGKCKVISWMKRQERGTLNIEFNLIKFSVSLVKFSVSVKNI